MESNVVSESLNEIKLRVDGNLTTLPFNTIIYTEDLNWEDFGTSIMHISTIARNFDIFINSILPKESSIRFVSTNSGGIILIKDEDSNSGIETLELCVSDKNIKHAIGQKGRNINLVKHLLIDSYGFNNLKKIDLIKKEFKIFGEK